MSPSPSRTMNPGYHPRFFSEKPTPQPPTSNSSSLAKSSESQELKSDDADKDIRHLPPSVRSDMSLALLMTEAVMVSRKVELANVLIGYEQQNRYVLKNQEGDEIGYIIEDAGFAKSVIRNVLRKHRPFHAKVLDLNGNVIFKLHRPMYLISSSMKILDRDDNLVGELDMHWHLWRRRYDILLHKKQFARVDTGFLGWEFEVKNQQGEKMAVIDRNFEGWAKLMLADAGMYAIHFETPASPASPLSTSPRSADASSSSSPDSDGSPSRAAPPLYMSGTSSPQAPAAEREPSESDPSKTSTASATAKDTAPPSSSNAITESIPEPSKEVVDIFSRGRDANAIASTSLDGRPLELDERAVCLAMAIAIDFDYFTTSNRNGLMGWFMPYPTYGGGEGGGAGAEGGDAPADGAAAGGSSGVGDSDAGGFNSYPPDNSATTFENDSPSASEDGGGGWFDSDQPSDDGEGGGWFDDIGEDGGDGEGGGGIWDTLGDLLGGGDD